MAPAMPQLSASYSGFVNGDSPASLSAAPTLSTTATSASPVLAGGYAIIAAGASDPDYTISYQPGTLLITPAPLTITANNATKSLRRRDAPALGQLQRVRQRRLAREPLGRADPEHYRYVRQPRAGGGLCHRRSGASDPDYTISYRPGTLLITAPESVAAGAVDPDYTISYQPGTLLITPAPLTITANDVSMVQGEALPPLTMTCKGLVNGDSSTCLTMAPTLTTSATPQSPAGTYPIVVSGACAANYAITYAMAS